MPQVKAHLKYLRMSPRKVRLVADFLKHKDVARAGRDLKFMPKKAARPLSKLLASAVANAKNNFNLSGDGLYIKEIRVDEGPVLKRWMPRAFGRASSIKKRTSHIMIVLDELSIGKDEKKKDEPKKKEPSVRKTSKNKPAAKKTKISDKDKDNK